jgi:hypothetical protein
MDDSLLGFGVQKHLVGHPADDASAVNDRDYFRVERSIGNVYPKSAGAFEAKDKALAFLHGSIETRELGFECPYFCRVFEHPVYYGVSGNIVCRRSW